MKDSSVGRLQELRLILETDKLFHKFSNDANSVLTCAPPLGEVFRGDWYILRRTTYTSIGIWNLAWFVDLDLVKSMSASTYRLCGYLAG